MLHHIATMLSRDNAYKLICGAPESNIIPPNRAPHPIAAIEVVVTAFRRNTITSGSQAKCSMNMGWWV